MPTVKTTPIGSVKANVAPASRQTKLGAESFGTGMAKGMASLAGSMDNMAKTEEWANKKEAAERKKAEAKARAAVNKVRRDAERQQAQGLMDRFGDVQLKGLFVGTNETTAFFHLQGKEATDAFDGTLQQMEDASSALLEELGEDHPKYGAVKEHFRKSIQKNKQKMAVYSSEQHRVGLNRSDAATAEKFYQLAMGDYGDPSHIENGAVAVAAMAKRKLGNDPLLINEAVMTYTSGAHTGVIGSLMNKGPDGPLLAETYYKENKDQINATSWTSLEVDIERGVGGVKGLQFAEQVVASGLLKDEAKKKAKKELEGTAEKTALSKINLLFAEQENAERNRQGRAAKEASEVRNDPDRTPADFSGPTKTALTDNQMKNEWAGKELRVTGNLGRASSVKYAQLVKMASSPDPKERAKFEKIHLDMEAWSLTDDDLTSLQEMQDSLVNTGQPSEKMEALSSSLQQATVRLDRYVGKSGSKEETAIRDKFERKLITGIQMLQSEKQSVGGTVSDKEITDLINGLFMTVSVKDSGMVWDDKKRVFELDPGEVPYVDSADVPTDFQIKMGKWWAEAYREGKVKTMKPTNQQMMEAWREKLKRGDK
ncbi:MAG: hypothetical protein GY753_09830 [Gammaproteobacteria bacterium]|nr:hypothetical protein [Gammaproteobacteria bacterium]